MFCPGSNRKPTTRIDPQSAICSKPNARRDPSGLSADTVAEYHAHCTHPSVSTAVEIVHLTGIDGARHARGTVVVIDVIRSFTVSAYALAGGALECLLVPTVAQALALHASIPGSLLSAEEDALPIPGIPISNSPTQVKDADLEGRVLVQRSSAGTTVMAAVESAENIYAASLVVARATVTACMADNPRVLTLLASADHPEDHACAQYLEGLIRGEKPDLDRLLQPLRESERYTRARSGRWPGFPSTDLDLSLAPDRFDFAMPATKHPNFLRLTAQFPLPPGGAFSKADP
jgi:2-phosphosulfolactate phosphatase